MRGLPALVERIGYHLNIAECVLTTLRQVYTLYYKELVFIYTLICCRLR